MVGSLITIPEKMFGTATSEAGLRFTVSTDGVTFLLRFAFLYRIRTTTTTTATAAAGLAVLASTTPT